MHRELLSPVHQAKQSSANAEVVAGLLIDQTHDPYDEFIDITVSDETVMKLAPRKDMNPPGVMLADDTEIIRCIDSDDNFVDVILGRPEERLHTYALIFSR